MAMGRGKEGRGKEKGGGDRHFCGDCPGGVYRHWWREEKKEGKKGRGRLSSFVAAVPVFPPYLHSARKMKGNKRKRPASCSTPGHKR